MPYDEKLAIAAVEKIVKGGDRAAISLTILEIQNVVWLLLLLVNKVVELDPSAPLPNIVVEG